MMTDLLSQLPDDARGALTASLRTQRFERGSIIYHTEDPAQTIYFLRRGRVRLYRIGSSAREVTIAVHEPEEIFGEIALESGVDYGMYAEALEDCEVQMLGAETLRKLMLAHPALNVMLSAQLARQGQTVQTRLTHLVFLEVSQRLALTLLRLADQDSEVAEGGKRRLRGRISHQDLAHLVGSTRETITKLLGEFKDRGYLDLGYRRIVLLDEDGLQEAALTRSGA
ncbi:CRP-like cAMP-binding protein [Deinobacterium chartae]|uniref:CRP-like cAMP-binding protein n=1 Tax=Deinobacterium chartae TaxID=521158 RepID=A0A841HZU5_9DEIO|nr:Crp/Fnr family transcriptional regulator [Deinobacterium chartae]MBB6098463.1 CRP-like cAMP-binding protein [Deinobacterium chartae]